MYDHGFRLDQDDARQAEYEKTIPKDWPPKEVLLSPLEAFRRLVFPHCDFENVIMTCTRKWFGRLEFTYMFYPGREYFYIAWKDKELWRKEQDVRRDQRLP